MARSQNGSMTDIADAKEHLRELGRSEPASVLGIPLAQAGALLAVGGLLERMLAPGRKDPISIPFRDLALRAGMTVAPLLIQQVTGCLSKRTAALRDAGCKAVSE